VSTAQGSFLTTTGHLGAQTGESVYRRIRSILFLTKWSPWGAIAAVTSPQRPDAGSPYAEGLDIAIIEPDPSVPPEPWQPVAVGDPRQLGFREYIRWNGGVTGPHEGWLSVPAAAAKAMDGLPYEHALMVEGNPPRFAGRDGDSGSAVFDADGRLLGHMVGTDGARRRSTAPVMWFQMIDIAHKYLEAHCGPIHQYSGDRGA
jgi:hypothetical protein